jgi:hypothetical protein
MKNISLKVLIFLLFAVHTNLFGQQKPKKEIKIWFEPQSTKESTFLGAADDDSWMEDGIGYGFGVGYSQNIKDKLWINTGLRLFYSSNVYKMDIFSNSQLNIASVNIEFKIISVPVGIGLEINKWLMINSGISIDYQYNNSDGKYISNQSGFSFYLTPNFTYRFANNLIIFIAPSFTHYSIFQFSDDKTKERIKTYGLNFGFSKQF